MRILIVCSSFYPVNSPRSFRSTELAKELVRQGHEVVLYCADTAKRDETLLGSFPFTIHEYHESTDSFAGKKDLVSRALFKLSHDLFEYPRVSILKTLPKAIKKESGYDLLISIAVPHSIHWAIGKMYQRGIRLAKVWVADCGDPYMLTQSGHKHPFYFKYLEKRWCRYCDYISVPTPDSVNGYYPEFRHKTRVIPQGFDFSSIRRKDYQPNNIVSFAYSGSFIVGVRDIRPVLDYLCTVNQNFRFYVFTEQKDFCELYKDRLGEKLVVSDYVERSELLFLLSGMDFLVNLVNSGVSVQTPSKLIDYSLTNRPILSIDSNHIDTELFEDFLSGNYVGQYMLSELDRYNIQNVAKQFVDLTQSK